jgi:hypothetical protein
VSPPTAVAGGVACSVSSSTVVHHVEADANGAAARRQKGGELHMLDLEVVEEILPESSFVDNNLLVTTNGKLHPADADTPTGSVNAKRAVIPPEVVEELLQGDAWAFCSDGSLAGKKLFMFCRHSQSVSLSHYYISPVCVSHCI